MKLLVALSLSCSLFVVSSLWSSQVVAAGAKKNATGKAASQAKNPVVEIKTSEGLIKLELYPDKAPITVKNFLEYVGSKFYDGTIFHRVIDGFMIQGGGMALKDGKLAEKATKSPIANEAKNGLKNDKGWVAMARTNDPNSATAQFFINLVNNDGLNYPKPDQHGYAVFGKVTAGMEVVEKIGKVKTTLREGMSDVPVKNVVIESMRQVK